MINQGKNVPDKTIAVFTADPFEPTWHSNDKKIISNIIDKPSKKRNWFDSHFYRCLPLTIGNQYGFIIKSEYDIAFVWDGGTNAESITLFTSESAENLKNKYLAVKKLKASVWSKRWHSFCGR